MNEDNRRKLWTLIQEAGLYLVGQLPSHPNHPKGRNPYAHLGQLPSHPNHPKGRNPYAHVALCVKEKV